MDLLETVDKSWTGLRRDLQIYAAAPELNGTESWVVEDPLNGKMFRFGAVEGALYLSLLKHTNVTQAYRDIILTTAYRPSVTDVVQFIDLLIQSALTNQTDAKPPENKTETHSFLQKLMHGYIYFRIPLARPDAFLTHSFPFIEWLWSPWMRLLYFLLGVLGVLLSLQQTALMSSGLSHLFTPTGFVSFMATLVILKLGHELAHGYTAKSHNLYVRSMGVAFILFWPVLYSDTTDAWKAKSNKVRFSISAAGVVFELVIAGLSLFFWSILSAGLMKEVCFYLATTSIVSSALVNLNPFMRFDGYYLLMDWWRIDNLQPRAFDLMKYRLRRLLFDWQGDSPEEHVQGRQMVLYAIATSVYRVFLAIVIATAVYHLFSREIGLFLMAIELWVFLIQPVMREFSTVWSSRQLVGNKWHLVVSLSLFFGIFLTFFIPFSETKNIPAVIKYTNSKTIYSPFSGRLEAFEVSDARSLVSGELMAELHSDQLSKDINDVRLQSAQNHEKIAGLSSEGEEGGYKKWLEAESKRLSAEQHKVQKSIDLMQVLAPFNGRVTDYNREIHVGDTVAKDTYLLTYSPYDHLHVEAFLAESDRLSVKQLMDEGIDIQVTLKLWNIHAPILTGMLRSIESFPTRMEDTPMLFDIAGGDVASADVSGKRLAVDRYFMMNIALQNPPDFHFYHLSPAWAQINFPARSLASHVIEWIAGIFYTS